MNTTSFPSPLETVTRNTVESKRQVASFRDPSGFVFQNDDGKWLRQINRCYESEFELLTESGLYESLAMDGLLIEHHVTDFAQRLTDDACAVIEPVQLEFVSYPYEWCFSQLKDAAVLTLEIQKRAKEHGMSLKDASAYNIQFVDGKPKFIDTLSFEKHEPGSPWAAYGQFCRHFLAPLALMSYSDIRLNRLLSDFIDGIPLDLASSMLPFRSRFNFGLLVHLHVHSRAQRKFQDTSSTTGVDSKAKVSDLASQGLIDSLQRTIKSLKYQPRGSEWSDYYQNNSYSDEASKQKEDLVLQLLTRIAPQRIWDLGANSGKFSRLAAGLNAKVTAFDIDPACVEMNYLECKKAGERNILPLVQDLTNPSSGVGWANVERGSLAERGPADAALALALIHHLAITGNISLPQIADYFHRLANNLIIEFVPKTDPQVKRLLRSRKDIFDNYTQEHFETIFKKRFEILEQHEVGADGRVLYLMKGLY